jgi:hypothetical protein
MQTPSKSKVSCWLFKALVTLRISHLYLPTDTTLLKQLPLIVYSTYYLHSEIQRSLGMSGLKTVKLVTLML